MKDKTKATATESTENHLFPITTEEVRARLAFFKEKAPAVPGQGANGLRLAAARRDAWYDNREATIKLDLWKMECALAQRAAVSDGWQDLFAELEAVRACRKMGRIGDDLSLAVEEFGKTLGPLAAAQAEMEELLTEVLALETKAAGLRARVIPVRHGRVRILREELRVLGEVMLVGKWKTEAKEDRAAALESELNYLAANGQYAGPLTEKGLRAKISEIEAELEVLNGIKHNLPTEEEYSDLQGWESRISQINAEISNARPGLDQATAAAAAAEEKFNERFDAALIAADSVVAVYEINCERLAIRRHG